MTGRAILLNPGLAAVHFSRSFMVSGDTSKGAHSMGLPALARMSCLTERKDRGRAMAAQTSSMGRLFHMTESTLMPAAFAVIPGAPWMTKSVVSAQP